MIEVSHLNYTAGKRKILSDISFHMKNRGFYGIVGNNGSGKTTLVRFLSGITDVPDNTIRIMGRDINSYSHKTLARHIALVPQHTSLIFDFSAHQIVLMGRMPYQKPLHADSEQDLETVRDCMTKTNTWHLRDMNVNNLSGGEFQRVIIARALAQQTPILFLDEAVSNLDIHHQIEIMDLLKRINAESETCIVMILHDLNLAMQYCDELLVLKEGSLEAFGPTEKILTRENIRNIFNVDASLVDCGPGLKRHIIISRL